MDSSRLAPIDRAGPGAACLSCRKMKMRCIRLSEAACQRCEKAGRPCLPARAPDRRKVNSSRKLPHRGGAQLSEPRLMSSPWKSSTPMSSGTDPPILASIYTTSPYAEVEKVRNNNHSRNQTHHDDLAIIESFLHTDPHEQDDELVIPEEHVAQLIMIFREKLMKTISILDPGDFMDVERLVAHHPDLVTSICYVTTRYIPGYQKYRDQTKIFVTDFLQASFDHQNRSDAEQIRTMESLMILYAFAPSTISQPSFSFVRAACEAYATKIGLHRAIDPVKQLVVSGVELSKHDLRVKRYLYWIWLYVISHHRSLVRRIPPTIPSDDSIQNAPRLLESLGQDKHVGRLLSELHSRLIWDDIGRKGKALTEWWADRFITVTMNDGPTVTIADIDAAVAYRRDQLLSLCPRKLGSTPEGISTEYHFRLAHFCLSTHLVLRITASNIGPSEIHIVQRCVDLAMGVLNLTHHLGPVGREAFRFQPGFVFVSVSFCISFVLQALQAFPDQFTNTQSMLKVIKRIASMMTDSAVDQTHDCGTAGRAMLRQLRITIEILYSRCAREQQRLPNAPLPAPSMPNTSMTQPSMPLTTMLPTTMPPTATTTDLDPQAQPPSQMPWTVTSDSFPATFMEDVNNFDCENLVLDPAFIFPDFFGYAPQIAS